MWHFSASVAVYQTFAVAFTKLGCRCSQIFAVAQTLVVGVCKLLPQRSRILLSLIFKRCNEISFVVAVLLLSCLRNLLLLCLLNDVVVTLLCRLPTPPPTLHPPPPTPFAPQPIPLPPAAISVPAKQEIPEVNICTIIAFFGFCSQTKKRKNGSKIAFFRFLYKKEKTEKRK